MLFFAALQSSWKSLAFSLLNLWWQVLKLNLSCLASGGRAREWQPLSSRWDAYWWSLTWLGVYDTRYDNINNKNTSYIYTLELNINTGDWVYRLSRHPELIKITSVVLIETLIINTWYNTQESLIRPSYRSTRSRVILITNHGAIGKFDSHGNAAHQIPDGTGPVVIDIRQVMNQARLPRWVSYES